jgi:hypothetical protein
MRINTWYVTLGIVGVSVAAVVACSSTTTVNNPTGDDAGVDTGTPEVDAAVDTGTTPADTGTTPATDAGEDAPATCAVALSTGDATCDTCVATSCCTQLTGCDTPDDAGVDDAGFSACEQLLGCINDFNTSADGGTDGGAAACNSSYSSGEQTSATAVLTCIESSCATQCPGL